MDHILSLSYYTILSLSSPSSSTISFIVLLCVHARDLMTGSRNLPTKPYSRLNMLAHQANYNQWKLDSGHDLAVILQYPFEFLVDDCHDTAPTPPQQHSSSSSASATVVTTQVVDWVESSMIKGELTIKLIFAVMQLSTHSLPQEVYLSLLTLLVWARSRGALPPSLALIEDDFHRFAMASHCNDRSRRLAEADEVHSSTVATASIYARSCYLRSYGLSLVNAEGLNSGVSGMKHLAHSTSTAQKNHSSSNSSSYSSSSSSWFGSLGGFLFSSSSSSANDDVHTNHARVMEAYRQSISSTTGLLDLPHLYCNTNASYVVDLKGAPIRPDDELLKTALQDCKPHVLLGIGGHQADSRFKSNSSEVLYALFDILDRMIVDLLASRDRRVSSLPGRASVPPPSPTQGMQTPSISRSGARSPQSMDGDSSHHSATKGPVDDDCGYPDGDCLLSSAAAIVMDAKDLQWLEVVELDAVCVLEWTCSIIFSSYDNLALFWPKMHSKTPAMIVYTCCLTDWLTVFSYSGLIDGLDLLKMVFEDNVDLFAARSPYFLERCICLILHATVTSISLRVHTSVMGTVTATDTFLREVEVDVDAGLNDVWLSLRLMRGVPSENISNLADRLGAGIHAIIRYDKPRLSACIVNIIYRYHHVSSSSCIVIIIYRYHHISLSACIVIIIYRYHHASLSACIVFIIYLYHHISLSSYIVIIIYRYHHISLSSYIVIIMYRYHHISLSSYVVISMYRYHHISLSSYIFIIICRYHHVSLSSYIVIIIYRYQPQHLILSI
jgi:hypothetical protein